MKKLILFATLCVFAFTTKAQELNFEETVKYIQSKINDLSYYNEYEGSGIFTAKQNGDLKFSSRNYKTNLFDLMIRTNKWV